MVGIFSRTTKECVVKPIPSLSRKNVEPILDIYLAPGSDVFTDEQVTYWFVGDKYEHRVVEHSTKQWVNGDAHTNNVECQWSLWRPYSRAHRGFSTEHLPVWSAWFSWLRNHRIKGEQWLRVLCESIVGVPGGLLRRLQAKGLLALVYPLLNCQRSVSM
jgi:hypothetical protein